MKHLFSKTLAVSAISALLLQACGGGGSGDGGNSSAGFTEETMPLSNTTLSFSGTAAVGAPIASRQISARCSDSTRFTGTTDATGRFTIAPAAAASLPCMFQVTTASGDTLYSIAVSPGTLNITPLTNALVYAVSGISSPFTRFNSTSPSTFRDGLTPSSIAQAKQVVSNMLSTEYGFSLPTGSDFLTTSFNANATDPLDKLLDDIKAADTTRAAAIPSKPSIASLAQSLSNNLISTADGRFNTVFGKNEIFINDATPWYPTRRPTSVRVSQSSTDGECSSVLVIGGQRVAVLRGSGTTYFTLSSTSSITNVETYLVGTTAGLPMAEGIRRTCGVEFVLFDAQGEVFVVREGSNSTLRLSSGTTGSRAVQNKYRFVIPAASSAVTPALDTSGIATLVADLNRLGSTAAGL